MVERVLIVGATSGIAQAVALRLARRGCRLILAARDRQRLEMLAAELTAAGSPEVLVEPFEALDFDGHRAFVERAWQQFGGAGPDAVLLCYAYLPNQEAAQREFSEARRTIDVNLTSPVSVLEPIAARFAAQGRGTIAVISSVAGDRGRRENYMYGATKAALTAYLSGLRNRLHASGVHVLTIQPGPVDTPMAAGRYSKSSPLLASPERVARDIERAIDRRRDVLYTPWYWRWIMLAVRMIPEPIFKRLNI